MSGRSIAKIIRDPIHEYISIYEDEIPLLDCALLQRLRNIKQNGMAYYTYPALIGSRFEHSLGVMHLADRMLSSALVRSEPSVTKEFISRCAQEFNWQGDNEAIKTRLSRVIRIVGLLHDLGQLPFSHTLEELIHQFIQNILPSAMIEKWQEYMRTTVGSLHEFLTIMLIEIDPQISAAIETNKDVVLRILQAPPGDKTPCGTLHELVAFDIDADRGDYLLRDGHTSGAEFGRFDVSRLVEGMRLAKIVTSDHEKKEVFVIRPTIRALSAVESLVIERYKSYRWLYYHQRVVATNRMLEEVIWRLLISNWDAIPPFNGIPLSFPLARTGFDTGKNSQTSFLDDIDVVNILRRAKSLLLNELEKSEETSTSKEGDWFREFAALLDEILLRKKRGGALWKDIATYKQFNDRVANAIEDIFADHQREKYKRSQGRVLPSEAIHKTTEDTDFTLNWLSDRLLGRSFSKRKELEMQINEELRKNNIDGFLLLSVTFFKPWGYRGEDEYEVIDGNADLFHVSDVSPIVKQLRETSRSSIRLYAYLILNERIENLSLPKHQDILREKIEESKKIFAQNLIGWARSELSKETK